MAREPRTRSESASETSYGKAAVLALGGMVGVALIYAALVNLIEPPPATNRETADSAPMTMATPGGDRPQFPTPRTTDGLSSTAR